MAQKQDEGGPDPVTIFAFISIGVVALAMIAFAILFIIGRSPVNLSTAPSALPYNINLRQIPTAQRAVDLLPEQIGPFKRGPITGTIKSYRATYKNGTNTIQISGSQAVSYRAAQAEVENVNNDTPLKNIVDHLYDADPSYILTGGDGSVRFIWSHQLWFFDVTASSKATLDAFMQAFRY